MNRSRLSLLAPLLAVLALLLGLAQSASAAFNAAATDPHYGNFLLQPSEAPARMPLENADSSREIGVWLYDSTLGVPVYVRQNPWTFFDPEGLELYADEKAKPVLDRIRKMDKRIEFMVQSLEKSKHTHAIYHTNATRADEQYSITDAGNKKEAKNETNGVGVGTAIHFNTKVKTENKYQKITMTPEEVMAHELQHSYDTDKGNRQHQVVNPITGIVISEERAVLTQNIIRGKQQPDKPIRDNYSGKKLKNPGADSSPLTEDAKRPQPSKPEPSAREIQKPEEKKHQ